MSDAFIQLNADGTGKKLDTRTEGTNSEHRQVFVLGDPANNAGVASVDATKGLAVDLTNTGANTTALKVDGSAVTQPVSLASVPSHAVTNAGTFAVQVTTINSVAPAFGTGVRGATVQRVTIATDDVVPASQSGAWTVQPGNTANTTAWLTKSVGTSVSSQTALTTTATVSGSAGTYVGGSYINLNSIPSYIQVFDTAGAVTLGATTPTFVQPIPANATPANGAAFVFDVPGGISITNGIKIAATTTATGASTSATALIGYTIYT